MLMPLSHFDSLTHKNELIPQLIKIVKVKSKNITPKLKTVTITKTMEISDKC